MRKKLAFVLPLVILTFYSFAIAQQQNVKFNRFTLDQGLSMNFITCIHQDSKGFIWVGTYDGLNRYDGYKFTVYKNDPKIEGSISNNSIVGVYEDKQGVLYIGTDNGGLSIYNKEKDTFTSFKHNPKDSQSIGSNRVTAIFEDSKGVLWLGTETAGLHIFDKKTKTFTRYLHDDKNPKSLINNTIRAINEDRSGNLWVGTEVGLSVLDPARKTFTHYLNDPANPNSLSVNAIRTIMTDTQGHVWIGTAFGGVNVFNAKSKSFVRYQRNSTANSIVGDYVPGICEDKEGLIWIATNFGISVFNKKTQTFTNHTYDPFNPKSLVDNGLNTIYTDKTGNIWVGSIAGLAMKEALPPKFIHYANIPGNANSLGSKEVFGFYEDTRKNIWIGLRDGFDQYIPQTNTFVHHKIFPSGQNIPTVTAFYEDKQHDFWLGMYDGLMRFDRDKGTFELFTESIPGDKASIPLRDVWYFLEDAKGELFISSFTRGLFRYVRNENRFEPFVWPGKYIPMVVTSFYIDQENTFWLGTMVEGLFKINPDKNVYEVFKHDDADSKSISDNFVQSIYKDQKGTLWVGTKAGLNGLDPKTKTFVAYRESNGLPNNSINTIKEDEKGTLWLGTNKGLSNFDPASKKFKNYTLDDGLQHNEFWHRAAYKLRSGEMLFGGLNGFNLFNPKQIQDNPFRPAVFVSDLLIFNKPVVAGGEQSPLDKPMVETKEMTLSYQENVFSFEFVALNYIGSKNNQYAYKLDGFDKDWNYVGTQRRANYTNIDPGEYTFWVKASNNDGKWNERGTSLKLIITPPFWQTWWFKTIVLMTIIGSALTFYRVRINAIKAQKEELERLVTERTAEVVMQKEELQAQSEHLQQINEELHEQKEEILEQREEIEIQRDNLQKINEHVMSSIAYANTIQKAILPAAAKIKEALPEHFILYRPKDVVSGDFYWFSHLLKADTGLEADYTFIAAVDCTGHGVPGAFMSIIGNTLLNDIVTHKNVVDPAQILELLDAGVKQAVAKAEGVNTAGMDVCLCRIQRNASNEVQIMYAGAKRPLLYVIKDTNEVERLNGDRKSIGSESQNRFAFTTQELCLPEGSMLYLTSDGYADQNNPQREKLGSAKVRDLIGNIAHLEIGAQKEQFEQLLDNHQETAEQRDDITVIGVRI